MTNPATIAKGLTAIAFLMLAGCGPESACIEGELYTDYNRDGVFVRETHDLSGKVPMRCEVPPAHLEQNT